MKILSRKSIHQLIITALLLFIGLFQMIGDRTGLSWMKAFGPVWGASPVLKVLSSIDKKEGVTHRIKKKSIP